MDEKLIEELYELGCDKQIEEFANSGYEFIDYADGMLVMQYDELHSYMCQYKTAEDISRFLNVHAKRLLKNNDHVILREMKKVNSVEEFYSIITEYTFCKDIDRCYYFTLGWKAIPNKDVLYELYKECLTLNESNELYDKLMQPDLIKEIKKHNKRDTINNQELIDLLDVEGYLTIYHGHITKSLKNHNSWTTKKEVAEYFGNRNALFNGNDEYYIITGKIQLRDIITYITDRNEFEIVVPSKCVNVVGKQCFKYNKDFERPFKE